MRIHRLTVRLGAMISLLNGSLAIADPVSLTFVPVTPCRVVDTRSANGPLGSPDLMPGTRDFPILSGACGIPNTAIAYSINVTAIPAKQLSYLTIYATGQDQPPTSTLNAKSGAPVANSVTVSAGASGSVRVFTTDETDLILDVDGYFVSAPTGAVGPQGPAGTAGLTGAVGPQGPAGTAGLTGAVGPQGPSGPTGATGAMGTQGPAGAPGAMGLPGIAGANGVNGTDAPIVWASSQVGLPAFGLTFGALSGLHLTPSSTESLAQLAAGTACSSVSITMVRTGATNNELWVGLRKNGAFVAPINTNAAAVVGNGANTVTFPLTIAPSDLLDTYFSNDGSGTAPTGTTYLTISCHP